MVVTGYPEDRFVVMLFDLLGGGCGECKKRHFDAVAGRLGTPLLLGRRRSRFLLLFFGNLLRRRLAFGGLSRRHCQGRQVAGLGFEVG